MSSDENLKIVYSNESYNECISGCDVQMDIVLLDGYKYLKNIIIGTFTYFIN